MKGIREWWSNRPGTLNMENERRPNPVLAALFFIFLIVFFGGGLLLVVHLFVPFLHEDAFALIALVIGSMFVVLAIVAKCVQMISPLRRVAERGSSGDANLVDEQHQSTTID